MTKPRPRTGFEIEGIPGEMSTAPRWVNWRAIERDGRWTKIPVDPNNGGPGKSNDPATWASFDTAVARAARDDSLGIGFVLGGGWLGVDLDGVADPITGDIADPWIAQWARDCGTFVEYSPSGTGLHAIFRGVRIPPDSQNRRGPVEVYEQTRFFCISGEALYPRQIGSSQEAVDALCSRFLAREAQQAPTRTEVPAEATVDHSAHDWRLACSLAAQGWAAEDIEHVLRATMIQQGRREKAARPDYIRRTVENAVRTAGERQDAGPIVAKAVLEIVQEFPEQTPYVIEKLLRRGEVGALIAPPKARKSFLVLDLAISVATGTRWMNRFRTTEGRVLIVDNELTLPTIASRVREIAGNRNFPISSLDGRLDCLALREDDRGIEAVMRGIRELEKSYDLIVFDALYMFLEKGMDENSNADMTVFLRKFRRFASSTGAACILVHHTSKGSQHLKETTDYGAGAGALGRAVDLQIALFRHEEDDAFVARFEVRSSAPVSPTGVRWNYPLFTVDDSLDVDQLYAGRKRKKSAED